MSENASGISTKQSIINAAGALSAELGLDNVSTRAVAEASGENIGSIHYHFGGKDGLFEAVAQDAIGCCCVMKDVDVIDALGDAPTPNMLSKAVRELVTREVDDMFRSNRPAWHSQVLYQLLQREDALFDMFQTEVLNPGMDNMYRFFKFIDSDMTKEDAFLRTIVLKMPIFAHANYRKAMLKRLGEQEYSTIYLQKLENLLVKQTLLVLGLPEE